MSAVRTTCPYCGVGCGILTEQSDGAVQVQGDADHPANRGALCSKGAALADTVGPEGRLLKPRVNGRDEDWETALNVVAQGFRDTIEKHGADSVAFYVSGQLLTEDYYVANKLMKGYIGSANIDTNSRLCMSSSVAAHKRAFGEDLVPISYDDISVADLIVLVGSNAAWCHPVLFRRILQAKEARPELRLVVIDPRRTPTCDLADLHLPLRAGTDVTLFNGLLSWLARHGCVAEEFVKSATRGVARTLLVADNTAGDVAAVSRICGIAESDLIRFYEWFGGTERVVTMFSQGVNQSSAGTDKASSIINAHLLTGRIGRAGMGPFSITGQPNAMGGREVGGLANMLAAHMEIENPAHRQIVQDFWMSPRIAQRAGYKAVEMFEAIHAGRIKALWIMATNPIVSMPNADRTREALKRCEFVVVSDCIAKTDTTAYAHVLLPAAAWGEKDGTVTNSDRHISRQRSFMVPIGTARPDWWMVCQVAKRMGFEQGFEFSSAAQVFDEHARLSVASNDGGRAFNIGGLVGLGEQGYADLEPIAWPVPAVGHPGTQRLFGDRRFFHTDRRARLVATTPRPPTHSLDRDYPLVLNTGRIRDQWHTMTRTGRSPRLTSHLPEPFVDLHPADALRFGLGQGALARVETRWGRLVARLRCSGEVARGSLFVPIHWSNETASDARIGALVSPAVDPVSGEPEFKCTPARIEPFVVSWYAVALTRQPLQSPAVTWWTSAAGAESHCCEMAGRRVPGDWAAWSRALLRMTDAEDWMDYSDRSTSTYRAACLRDDRLEACLFVNSRPELPSRSWLASHFKKPRLSLSDRANLLAGRPADAAADAGETVCACFHVGRNSIEAAIAQGHRDVQSLGRRLKAGSNCGSCIPELRRIVASLS